MVRRPRPSPEREAAALERLAALLARTSEAVERRRPFSCAGCDAHCCKVGKNGMLVTRLEATALVERLRADPALRPKLPRLVRRVRETVRRYRLSASDASGARTYTCPFLDETNRCLVHGRGQPLGCITFMPQRRGGCDQEVGTFEASLAQIARLNDDLYGPAGWVPMLIPVAVERALESRAAPPFARSAPRSRAAPSPRARR